MFPRVKEVLKTFNEGGIEGVKLYFEQEGMEIDPSTWSGNIKKSLDEGHTIPVVIELKLIREKFNFYKYDVSEERSDTGTDSANGKGHKEDKGQIDGEGESRES